MKTIQEVEQWRAEFGGLDDLLSDPICHLFVRYVEPDCRPKRVDDYFDLFCFREGNEIVLWLGAEPDLIIPIVISRGGPEIEDGRLMGFGVEAVTRGVWALNPSLNIPGVIHGFVTFYDVPVPAPWERLILLPHEVSA